MFSDALFLLINSKYLYLYCIFHLSLHKPAIGCLLWVFWRKLPWHSTQLTIIYFYHSDLTLPQMVELLDQDQSMSLTQAERVQRNGLPALGVYWFIRLSQSTTHKSDPLNGQSTHVNDVSYFYWHITGRIKTAEYIKVIEWWSCKMEIRSKWLPSNIRM